MKRRIIIDTDPGQDDAVAILLALARPDAFDIAAITTVGGNVPLPLTTANALRILDLAEASAIPVHAGCAGPMVVPLETGEFVCGPDGLAGSGLPPPVRAAAHGHGVATLITLLRASAPASVTICALAPLTNIAMALRLAPEIAEAISEIVLMGGAMNLGNITPAAEYNFYADPHAADVVMRAGIKTTLIGLNLTWKAIATPAHVKRLLEMGTRTSTSVHGMLTRPRASGLGTTAHPMHDVCVMGFLLWPELFTGRDCFVEVETGNNPLRGRTTIDWNGRLKRPANAFVLDGVDSDTFFDRTIYALAVLP